ncbi:MAG TPA: DUF4905 domain-containing protein [Bacteroidota bacterium]|nr:DUF4905 domain-containing protein [Bacteroidota bacterium]
MARIFGRKRLGAAWEFESEGIIWRLIPVTGGKLAGEERNIETKTASFFCVNHSGTLWRGKSYGEQWWTGIEAAHRGVLFLHGYATPDLPGRKGITAVDSATGEVLWKNSDVTFLSAAEGSVYASREGAAGKMVLALDLRTGIERMIVGRGDDALRSAPPGEEESVDVIFPQTLSTGSSGPDAAIAARVAAGAAEGFPVEYASGGAYVVVSCFRRQDRPHDAARPYRQELRVVELAGGATAHEATIDPAVAGPRFGAFLIMGETLLFVRGQKTLAAVPLRGK